MKVSEIIADQLNSALNYRAWGNVLYNVEVYGATGDGIRDDTQSVQDAIDTAISNNATLVFFPPGTYKVTSLSNTSTINFVGDNATFVGYVGTIQEFGVMQGTWLQGKKINIFGDSNGVVTSPTYPEKLAEILKCTVNNYSVSGAKLRGNDTNKDISQQLLIMDTSADINIIFAGTNDWDINATLGFFTDTNYMTSIYGALNYFATKLVTDTPHAINIFMSPFKRTQIAAAGATDYPLEAIADAMRRVCRNYNFIFIDLHNSSPNLNPYIPQEFHFMPDNLHITSEYVNTFFARYLAERLVSLTNDCGDKVLLDFSNKVTAGAALTSGAYQVTRNEDQLVTVNISGLVSGTGDTTIATLGVPLIKPERINVLTCMVYNGGMVAVPCWIDTSGVIKATLPAGSQNIYINGTYYMKW